MWPQAPRRPKQKGKLPAQGQEAEPFLMPGPSKAFWHLPRGTQAGQLGLLVAVGDGCQQPGLPPRSLRRCTAAEPCPVADRLGAHHQWREGLGPAAHGSQGRELRKARGRHQRPDWTSAPDPTRAPFQFSPVGLGEVQADGNWGPPGPARCAVVWCGPRACTDMACSGPRLEKQPECGEPGGRF